MKYNLICIDLDGVLVNFTGAAAKAHNIELPQIRNTGIPEPYIPEGYLYGKFKSKGQFWKKCHHHDFWTSLQPYPWAKDIIKLVVQSKIPFVFLTKAPMGDGAWSGKARWIEKHFGRYQNNLWVVRGSKALMSRPGYLLIDDKLDSIVDWENEGGDGFHWRELHETALLRANQQLYYLSDKIHLEP